MKIAFGSGAVPDIPVFMISRKCDLSTKLVCYMRGALKFFTKPIELDALAGHVAIFEARSGPPAAVC